jgi:hypothetical protein
MTPRASRVGKETSMNSRLITAGIAAAALAPALAACGGGSSGGSSSSGTTAPAQTQSASAQAKAGTPASSGSGGAGAVTTAGGLTPPGTHLGVGQAATVGWVPQSTIGASGAQKTLKLRVTVESIDKGTIADFKNVQLNASERKSTPYYVKVRIKALGSTAPKGADNDPAITFDAIDDRGQQQQSVTFFGTFGRCNDTTLPKQFANGMSYESCLAYLMPGGGSIQRVQWADGPAKADDVSPYFDHPVVWGSS